VSRSSGISRDLQCRIGSFRDRAFPNRIITNRHHLPPPMPGPLRACVLPPNGRNAPLHLPNFVAVREAVHGPFRRVGRSPVWSLLGASLPHRPATGKVAIDPMYGPAVRCKSLRRSGGERSCINVSGLWLEHWLLAIMDISARAISLPARPRPGHLGHQCSHAPGRPNLHFVSSSRRPRLASRIDQATSSRPPHLSMLISRWTIKQLGRLR